jgi:hypothetical protein
MPRKASILGNENRRGSGRGWKSTQTLLKCYQQADEATMLHVVLGGAELREKESMNPVVLAQDLGAPVGLGLASGAAKGLICRPLGPVAQVVRAHA